MIRKLRIQITLLFAASAAIFIILFLYSTYNTTRKQLKEDCYSDMSYIISDISSASESTYPIAVVTVNYTGKMSLILNHMFTSDKEQVLAYAADVLKSDSSSGTIGSNIRYIRKSLGYSNIRIALVDYTSEIEILATQRRNYLVNGATFIIVFLFLGILVSYLITIPIEKAMIAQKQFIANASHELKTPLTVILSNLDMIDRTSLGDKDRSRMENISSEAARMRELIGDMLQIARYDSSLLPVTHTKVDLSYVIQCGVATYEPMAFDKGLTITSDISDGVHVTGNEQRLGQLIEIFLDNALKYCQAGGCIHVTLTSSMRSAQLQVTSQGTPIAKQDLDKIFSNFYRSDSTMSSAEGNGLGLAIARKIVEDIDGRIWAESDDNTGTNSFYVMFKA